MYGVVALYILSLLIDRVVYGPNASKVAYIISEQYEAITQKLLQLDRGVTLLHGKTGYLGIETDVLSCVISPRELYRTEKVVHEVDPNAFIVLSKVSSVTGRGFTKEKKYIPKNS